MVRTQKSVPEFGGIILMLVLVNAIEIREGYTGNSSWYLSLFLTIPILLLVVLQSKKTSKQHTTK